MIDTDIVTHINTSRVFDPSKCFLSVAAGLPASAEHKKIYLDGSTDFMAERYKAAKSNKFVGFVDDDDCVSRNAIRLCRDAIIESGAGIAYTDEVYVDKDGKRLGMSKPPNNSHTYDTLRNRPGVIHHFVLMRSDAILEEALEMATRYGWGIEWIMMALAGITRGAIRVPIDGYYWTHHAEQHHKGEDQRSIFATSVFKIQKELIEFQKFRGPIPIWN